MKKMYDVNINGCDAKVEVVDFTPPQAPITHLLPEDCDPGDPGEIAWKAATGNELLDNYIDNDESISDEDEEQLYEQLLQKAEDAKYENAISAYEDSKYE